LIFLCCFHLACKKPTQKLAPPGITAEKKAVKTKKQSVFALLVDIQLVKNYDVYSDLPRPS